jgi:hypothetical protein
LDALLPECCIQLIELNDLLMRTLQLNLEDGDDRKESGKDGDDDCGVGAGCRDSVRTTSTTTG